MTPFGRMMRKPFNHLTLHLYGEMNLLPEDGNIIATLCQKDQMLMPENVLHIPKGTETVYSKNNNAPCKAD